MRAKAAQALATAVEKSKGTYMPPSIKQNKKRRREFRKRKHNQQVLQEMVQYVATKKNQLGGITKLSKKLKPMNRARAVDTSGSDADLQPARKNVRIALVWLYDLCLYVYMRSDVVYCLSLYVLRGILSVITGRLRV